MQEFINNFVENIQYLESTSPQIISILLGMSVIVLESMIPILPLALFIALNMLLFGHLQGFIMSWIATCIGCLISFTIVRYGLKKPFNISEEEDKTINKIMKKINKISLPNLVLIISLPFMPAFLLNIAAGLSKISYKKFIFAILISKLVIVFFWGFIGTSLIESITDIKVLLELFILMGLAYIISKILMKKFKID